MLKKILFLSLVFSVFTFCEKTYATSLATKLTSRIYKDVAIMRSLQSSYDLKVSFKSKRQVKSYVLKRFKQEYTDKELELERVSLVKFGFLKEDFNYRRFLLRFFTSQVAGYYDPSKRSLFLAQWLPFELQEPTIAHELVHLIQDSNFHVENLMSRNKTNDDQTLSVQSLLEGDATKVMIDFMVKRASGKTDDEIAEKLFDDHMKSFYLFGRISDDIPEFIKQALIFPYISGFRFVKALQKKGGWKNVNGAYADLPVSTEQILHPEKYPAEGYSKIVFDKKRLKKLGWNVKSENSLGEFFNYLLLKNYLPEKNAKLASEGWNGDSYVLCSKKGMKNYSLLSVFSFDTVKDVAEFEKEFVKMMEKRKKDKDEFILKREGLTVIFADGFDDQFRNILKKNGIQGIATIIERGSKNENQGRSAKSS